MSNVAATRGHVQSRPWSYLAAAFAFAAAAVWVLAGIVDDSLYVLTGALGIVGFGLGLKGFRDARHTGGPRWPALIGIALGGLLGAAVIVASIAYGVSHLVS